MLYKGIKKLVVGKSPDSHFLYLRNIPQWKEEWHKASMQKWKSRTHL